MYLRKYKAEGDDRPAETPHAPDQYTAELLAEPLSTVCTWYEPRRGLVLVRLIVLATTALHTCAGGAAAGY